VVAFVVRKGVNLKNSSPSPEHLYSEIPKEIIIEASYSLCMDLHL
jgi:hypothetical protein